MSAEYSVGQIRRAIARMRVANLDELEVERMLTAYAERIEADERAVPVADWRIGMFDRWNEAAQEKGYAGICEAINAVPTAAIHPHSPDAADSGRVDVAKLLCDVRAIYIGATRPSGDGCDAETWDRIEAALAAQGQVRRWRGCAKP